MSGYEAYKLVKDGHIWDYSTHAVDVVSWMAKILREEPEADLVVESATRAEMVDWKEW